MKHPEVERTIRKSMQRGGDMKDILQAVLNVFNEYADSANMGDLEVARAEIAAVTATALYKAKKLGV